MTTNKYAEYFSIWKGTIKSPPFNPEQLMAVLKLMNVHEADCRHIGLWTWWARPMDAVQTMCSKDIF